MAGTSASRSTSRSPVRPTWRSRRSPSSLAAEADRTGDHQGPEDPPGPVVPGHPDRYHQGERRPPINDKSHARRPRSAPAPAPPCAGRPASTESARTRTPPLVRAAPVTSTRPRRTQKESDRRERNQRWAARRRQVLRPGGRARSSTSPHAGGVTALVGDNGAGKSTLVKCIGGIYKVDAGAFLFEASPSPSTPPRRRALGIEIVYQDLALCDNLDVVQNMFLGRERLSRDARREHDEKLANRRSPRCRCGRSVGTAARRQPVRRPAPDRRDRQVGAVEVEGRHPRRADGCARGRADGQVLEPGPTGSPNRASR